jgi:hypothetical protein
MSIMSSLNAMLHILQEGNDAFHYSNFGKASSKYLKVSVFVDCSQLHVEAFSALWF